MGRDGQGGDPGLQQCYVMVNLNRNINLLFQASSIFRKIVCVMI